MNDGAILCFYKSFFVKTLVCFALINDPVLPATPQASSMFQESQEAQEMCTPQEAPSPSLAGASKGHLLFRYADSSGTHITPTVHRFCSASSAKQEQRKEGF